MQLTKTTPQIVPDFSWDAIDTVFLDMDGTLLDKYYDDYFWEQYVPEVYAAKNQLDIVDAGKTAAEHLSKCRKHPAVDQS